MRGNNLPFSSGMLKLPSFKLSSKHMLHFGSISKTDFLKDYWQKKPLVIRQALPDFVNSISPDELAGLSLEEDMDSRIVVHTPQMKPYWHLQRGPFTAADFKNLPESHWTLLVQGVDRVVPEVYQLLDHFDFIPQWRIDDVMISFAAEEGSVGPHYDNYDVFLYQAKGRRRWMLTTENCTPENYVAGLELRIMDQFAIEQEFVLEEGDMLYLPAHVGHHGVSLSEECMTYSFGYRSYQGQELWDTLGDFISEKGSFTQLYQDPDWSELRHNAELIPGTWHKARDLLLELVNDEKQLSNWFGAFATRLDRAAEQHLPEPLEADDLLSLAEFIHEFQLGFDLQRDACCRFAYQTIDGQCQLYINGYQWPVEGVSAELVHLLANNRLIYNRDLLGFLRFDEDCLFLYELWKLQWIQFVERS